MNILVAPEHVVDHLSIPGESLGRLRKVSKALKVIRREGICRRRRAVTRESSFICGVSYYHRGQLEDQRYFPCAGQTIVFTSSIKASGAMFSLLVSESSNYNINIDGAVALMGQ